MQVLIIGAAGMIGGKLARVAGGDRPSRGSSALTLVDVVAPAAPEGAIAVTTGDARPHRRRRRSRRRWRSGRR